MALPRLVKLMAYNKFRAVKTVVDGIVFDSKLEAKKYQEFKLLEKAGEIQDLQLQVRYDLCVNNQKVCTYVADFVFVEKGVTVVYDAKGMILPEFRLKAKLFKAIHGFDITLSDGIGATERRTKARKAKGKTPKVALTRSR